MRGANTLSRSNSQVDIAIQQNLLRDKTTIRFAVNVIIREIRAVIAIILGFTSSSYGYHGSRQARLSFSDRFSKGKTKTQRLRKSALESESGRMEEYIYNYVVLDF